MTLKTLDSWTGLHSLHMYNKYSIVIANPTAVLVEQVLVCNHRNNRYVETSKDPKDALQLVNNIKNNN